MNRFSKNTKPNQTKAFRQTKQNQKQQKKNQNTNKTVAAEGGVALPVKGVLKRRKANKITTKTKKFTCRQATIKMNNIRPKTVCAKNQQTNKQTYKQAGIETLIKHESKHENSGNTTPI